MSNRNKTRKVAAIGAVVAVAVAVAAVAYWSGSGSGTGSGDVGTSSSVTLTGTVAPGSAPGTAQSVSFTAANASKSPVRVSTVHLAGITVDGAHAACVTADFTMADVTENHQVPAEATTEVLPNNGSLAYANTSVSQDACKGATLTLTFSST
jgi:hypothetical protein